jgi:hypothetical protein
LVSSEDGTLDAIRRRPAVAVDRADEGDTARRPADAPDAAPADAAVRPVRADGGAERERQEIARRLHRVLVDHAYGVARDAWAEASPDLRAAWENHKVRYPERERPAPRTTPDGGWTAGPHRRLSPEQNAEASKACVDIADEGRRDILPALKRVESAEPDRHLAGLKHMLKGEDRLKEKIADFMQSPDATVRDALGMVPDAVRFTFTYSPQRYASGVLADVGRLKSEGFELIKLKNLWENEQYKGINSQWQRSETKLRFEVQFHTPESLEAKELTHEAYERIRASAPPEEREELERFQRTANALLVTPERTAEIKDYPEKQNG